MTRFLADTHAIVWRVALGKRLGVAASAAFDEADAGNATIIVPAVVLAELWMIASKQRVAGWTSERFDVLVAEIRGSSNYELTSLTPDIVLASRGLGAIKDIFDRLVAAEALILGAAIISRDPTYTGLARVVWE